MGKPARLTQQDWLRMGFTSLVESGPSSLKAEPLARRLNTTKGSFYWHFKDIGHFQQAMLEYWQQGAFTDIVRFLETETSVPKRLRLLGQIATSAAWPGYEGAPIEPAIRAWSRSDAKVAKVVLQLDKARLDYLQTMLEEIGLGNPDFARLIYAGLIGLEDISSRDGRDHTAPMGTLIDLILSLE